MRAASSSRRAPARSTMSLIGTISGGSARMCASPFPFTASLSNARALSFRWPFATVLSNRLIWLPLACARNSS